MPIQIDPHLTPAHFIPKLRSFFDLSGQKILAIEKHWDPARGTPVFTQQGQYTSRGWTEWTQGFQFGSALLQFDVTGDPVFLDLGRSKTLRFMASHVSHVGVHDHGFNNVSTYGNLLRLMREGRILLNEHEQATYELALKVSGAIQAARWTAIGPRQGYIYSFNGPHSLFVDTIRSLRSLALAHQLGHPLMAERDERISLLQRLVQHAESTARFSIYYGEGRDAYDMRGRTAHESIFNTNDGSYRCPNSQQGYSPFTTWTRGLAWALCGFAEQLEFLSTVPQSEFEFAGGWISVQKFLEKAALATADFYLENACACGIPMWDTGAPLLHQLGDYSHRPADPFNPFEPVDSSAAAIAAQGLIRLSHYLSRLGRETDSQRYWQAGLTVASTLFSEPYLSTDPNHQGLILHSVYHRPNGWDYVHPTQKVPNGESSMWGDYHARELAVMLWRAVRSEKYLTFFN